MTILNDTVLESNKYLKLNFDGGDLSSDAGSLLIKEFACKLGFIKILKSMFKTNDSATFRLHKDDLVSYAVCYGEFMYQAGSWKYPRRVVCKVIQAL